MTRTSARLSDGREIIYFDDDGDSSAPAHRVLVDSRNLTPTDVRSETRYDAVLDEWVIMASHRQGRTHLPPSDECPLCPSNPTRQTEVPSSDYDVAVFENRFPSLSSDVPPVSPFVDPGDMLFARQAGVGRCEVVCFSSDHNATFGSLSPRRVRTVVDAWADRTTGLSGLDHVEYVFPFENRGEAIGVTLNHPHGQIYAYPFVPPRTRRMLQSARAHRERTWRNLFADILAEERRAGVRVVAESEHWTAFVPAAARWPVEVHLYPHRQVPDLPALTSVERDDFAVLYLDVLRRLDGLFGFALPYIAAWQQAPVRVDRELGYLHLQVFSIQRAPAKLKYLAGSESGVGVFINDIVPEQTARLLRDGPP